MTIYPNYKVERIIEAFDAHMKDTAKRASNNAQNSSSHEFQFMRGQIDALKSFRLWWLDNSENILKKINADAETIEPLHLNKMLKQLAEYGRLDIAYYPANLIRITIVVKDFAKTIKRNDTDSVVISLLQELEAIHNRGEAFVWNDEMYKFTRADSTELIEKQERKCIFDMNPYKKGNN